MERVSSQLTILIRIALPTILISIVLSLIVLLSSAVQGRANIFTNPVIIASCLLLLAMLFALFKFVFWRIYRVDMDATHLYVSNYFKSFKYPFTDIDAIVDSKILPGRVYIIILKSRGSFGRRIPFLASKKLWQEFVEQHPEAFRDILQSNPPL